ncbi:MAG: hypothetical protein GDA53_08955 [Rhodobacteraceae bacterium]|nr:hypothetical protein [Paracoccaceae bacterium]
MQLEYSKISADVRELERRQRNAVAADSIGVFFLLIPVGSLAGAEVEGELATAKGRLLAIESRARACAIAT